MQLDKTSRIMFGIVEAISANRAELLAKIDAEASALAGIKQTASEASREARESASPALWTSVVELAESVTNAAGSEELDAAQRNVVFAALITDAVKGGEPAVKSVKAYTSTAKSCISAVTAGKLNWHQVRSKLVKEGDEMREASVTYKEVRDMLKSGGQKELDALCKQIETDLRELRGRENDTRSVDSRMADLRSLHDLIAPMAAKVREVREMAKSANKRAAAVNSLRQQQPAGPMTTEVTAKPEAVAA